MDLKIIAKTILLTFLGICCSCEKKEVDFENETKTILALEAKSRQNHFSKNTKAFVESFSKDFLSINKGKIEKPTYQNSFKRFDAYFKSVRFIKWDDNQMPIVRFSEDASIAYVAVDKFVVVEFENESGKKVLDTTNFAWLSIFKKERNQWKLDCIASTNK